MSAVKLSVAIITLNEEANIGRCIESVLSVADEVVVVDSGSTDNTAVVAEQLGARVVTHPFEGHVQQKNYALACCAHDHVLSLDADEALTPELQLSIGTAKAHWSGAGYRMNRLTNYCGHWVKHCGWYPDTKLRLVNRHHAQWQGENPHDRLELLQQEAAAPLLKGDLLHYSFPTIASHIRTLNSFSEISSRAAFARGRRASLALVLLNPAFTFWKKYLLQLGVLDGYYGFVISWISAFANFAKYTKLRQLHREAKQSKAL